MGKAAVLFVYRVNLGSTGRRFSSNRPSPAGSGKPGLAGLRNDRRQVWQFFEKSHWRSDLSSIYGAFTDGAGCSARPRLRLS